MNRIEMKDLLDQKVDPLDISIKKWEDILNGNGTDLGSMNCALCETYRNERLEQDELWQDEICGDCPVRYVTGDGECADTPYTKWVHHQLDYHLRELQRRVHCPGCKEIAQEEIDFLKSLKTQVTEVP